jgi:hypothetical protein
MLARMSSSGRVGVAPTLVVDAINRVRDLEAPLSLLEQTAYELYSSSFSTASSDARFIVLMMAVETLINPRAATPRSLSTSTF